MKLYLAARYSRRQELLAYRAAYQELGYEVTSRWLDGQHVVDRYTPDPDALRRGFADEDLADLLRSDLVVVFTEEDGSPYSRGGRHVELGYALGVGKEIVLIGPRENVFCYLAHLAWFPNWAASVGYMVRRLQAEQESRLWPDERPAS